MSIMTSNQLYRKVAIKGQFVRHSSKLSFLITLSLNPFSAIAITDNNSENQIETIVTTANRQAVNHLELIGNTSVISQSNIVLINAQHLNQVLGLASGVWLSRGIGQESLLSIRSPVLTGAGSCAEFLNLENGISLRSPGFCNVNQLFDSHFEASNNIEVVKGSNSARYGSSAINGTINIQHDLINAPNTIGLDVASDDFYRLNGRFNNQGDKVNLGSAITLTSEGGYQYSSGYQQQKISLSAEHELHNWQTTHFFSFTNLEQDTAGYLQQGENAYKDKDLLKINAFPDAYRDSLTLRYSMKNEQVFDDVSWRITPYLRYTKMDFLMHFLPGTPVEENGHHSIGLQLHRLQQVSDSLSFSLGLDSEYTQGFLKQHQANETDSDSAFLRAVLPQGAHYDYEVDAQNIAVYLQIDYALNDKHAFSSAIRQDYTGYDYQNHLTTGNLKEDGSECGFGGCRYTRPADQTNRFNDTSFTLGYAYTITHNAQLFAKYDDSFRAPHTSELYRLQNGQVMSDIDSVNAKQQEVGVRFGNHILYSEVSIYNLEKTNGIYQDSDRQYLNGLDTTHQGVEIDLTWQITQSLNTQINTSYANHRYDNNPTNGQDIKGNQIDTSPRLIANLLVYWQISDSINTQYELKHLDGYYLDAGNSEYYNGHTLSNLRARWDISHNLRASFAMLNVFDTRYAERADFAFGNHRYFVGEPRSFEAGLRYQF